jgi:glutamine synthetase
MRLPATSPSVTDSFSAKFSANKFNPDGLKMNQAPEFGTPISEYFGEMTFGTGQMREKLPREAYQELIRFLEQGKKLSPATANAIAHVIKDWAVSKGATHFCHWFQPMTGLTAEKHDAFVSIQHTNHSELKVIERFSGSQLIQGEPDASSFPSGGMRSTFEARGYTAWDPTSPLFIVEGSLSRTLCIPSVFFGYHGQALDNKTPLLRSQQAVSSAAVEFLKLLGDVDVRSVTSTLGVEQEYFLIDRAHAAARPDIIMTGRTLIGAPAARGQKLEDHYFGAIPGRVKAFMEDLERELYKLGVPVKTRHNEVAPSQFELAPIFENMSIAVDHNCLTMETMRRVAIRHGFLCMLHEKPFAGINGSGKHCNWSLANDKGENLLDPGTTPHQNLRFLAMTSIVVKAVHEHADALRASIASPGNDHRLGGNEAPPAIISVFLGSLLEDIFKSIEKGEAAQATESQIIDLGIGSIPDISKDYTDRNRTSPFAFTGNKFEFRAVGASQNVAVPMTILNGAVTAVLKDAASKLKKLLADSKSRDEAVMTLIREYIKAGKGVLFSGNGYSAEWRKEAKARKLPILDTSADALAVFGNAKASRFLVDTKILTEEELKSRYHIAIERHVTTLEIEHSALGELVREYVIPSIEKQITTTAAVAAAATTSELKKAIAGRVKTLEHVFARLLGQLDDHDAALKHLHGLETVEEKIRNLTDKVAGLAKVLRSSCDEAELLVADEFWSLPKYREMLFANVLN